MTVVIAQIAAGNMRMTDGSCHPLATHLEFYSFERVNSRRYAGCDTIEKCEPGAADASQPPMSDRDLLACIDD
jgi:hypothetical protein